MEQALDLFRRQGYEGTSLTDLTTAMGINRPSLYAAFGNKEALFRAALDSYCASGEAWIQKVLDGPVARDAIEKLLLDGLNSVGSDSPQGCLLVKGALTGSEEATLIQGELSARRHANEALLRRRLERARTEGELPEGSDPADLARYFSTIIEGFSVQAVGGASEAELARVAKMAMLVWPE